MKRTRRQLVDFFKILQKLKHKPCSSFSCAAAMITGVLISLYSPQTAHGQNPSVRQSTSPLEILREAPTVRIDDPEPTPRPEPVPYVPPRGPAPAIQRVEPAFTPYAGATVGGASNSQTETYYAPPPPIAPRYSAPTPTPRPVLGPEDVDPKPKKGFVRGLINAIPFVGGDDDDDEKPVPTPPARVVDEPEYVPAPANNTNIYRGYDTAPPSQSASDGPLLLPPVSTPLPGALADEPEPSSPPIMTPIPRKPPLGNPVSNLDDTIAPGLEDESSFRPEPANDAPILTVKRESDTSSSTAPMPNAAAAKVPSVARSLDEEQPKPLERATTSVLIQESRPPTNSLGPVPDSSAAPMKSFDPAATPTPVAGGGLTAVDDVETSLVIEQADLGMPNPTYEQNTAVLAEFQDAVRKARAEDYSGAAQDFRAYGVNHPSSGLAPRAYFLSIVFEKKRSRATENLDSLRQLFPESRYLKDIETRRSDLANPAASDIASTAAPTENVRQAVVRLETELTAAVGDTVREPTLRLNLGLGYLKLEEYDRAYEVLRPAAEMTAGQPAEGEVLLALGRVLVARGETVQAISLYDTVEQKYPALIYKDGPSAWSVGLAFEGAGRYSKARAIYNTLRQRWPETAEAGWATTRLTDLASLQ